MLKRCAVLALVLLPVAAGAQAVPPLQRVPPIGTGPQGIVVQGRGVVRYPVKNVSFAAQVRGYADEAAVLTAMRAAGIEDPVIGPPGSQLSSGTQSMLRGTVRDATQAKLERIALAAADFVRAHPGVALDGVSVFPGADGCAPHEQGAREAAFADARRRAQAVAALAGLTVDGIAAVSEIGGCPPGGDSPLQGYSPSGGPFDLATLTATVSVTETITFSVSAEPAPARRRTL
jgi:hypothetical protein